MVRSCLVLLALFCCLLYSYVSCLVVGFQVVTGWIMVAAKEFCGTRVCRSIGVSDCLSRKENRIAGSDDAAGCRWRLVSRCYGHCTMEAEGAPEAFGNAMERRQRKRTLL